MIIIFVLEGSKSNTEVNFFRGWSKHFQNLDLKIYPLEKIRKSIKRANAINGRTREIMQEHAQSNENVKFFFIGDGDDASAFEAMNNTKDITVKYLTKMLKMAEKQITNKILMHLPFSFENSYRRMANGYFPPNAKKRSEKHIFNLFAEKANWFKKDTTDTLDYSKIIRDMKKTKNPHVEIIQEIKKKEDH